jgi:hypothetical protein
VDVNVVLKLAVTVGILLCPVVTVLLSVIVAEGMGLYWTVVVVLALAVGVPIIVLVPLTMV